jgi:UDP-glucose 4-epimerase
VRPEIQFILGDLADPVVCRTAVEGVDYVFHQAAIPSVPRSIDDPDQTNRANVAATLNLAAASSRAKIKRLVFASTCAIYGDAQTLPIAEGFPERPMSPYALSKLMGEQYLDMCRRTYGLEAVSLRYFNVFGPRQDPGSTYSGVISRFLSAVQSGTRPVVFGDGNQTRDFVYVENVAHANLLACHAENAPGQVINIGTGKATSLLEVLRTLSEIAGAKSAPDHQPPRAGDIRHSLADIERARRVLGYNVQVGFEEGLRRTIAWFKEHSDRLPPA